MLRDGIALKLLFMKVILLSIIIPIGALAVESPVNEIDIETAKTIEGALSSEWVNISETELEKHFARYYTGELLNTTYEAALKARSEATEWVEQVKVEDMKLAASSDSWKLVKAALTVTPGAILKGEGYFLFTGDPARISYMKLVWEEQDTVNLNRRE